MFLRILAAILGGLGVGTLTSAVGLSLLFLMFRKAVLSSFPEDRRKKASRVLYIFSWVSLILAGGLFGFSAVYFGKQLVRRVLLQPAFILAVLNLLFYAFAIAPPLAGIRGKLGDTFPGYYKAIRNSAFAHYVAMNLSSGVVVALGTLAMSLYRERALGVGNGLVLASSGIGLVRLFTSVASSFSDLSRVQLYADNNFRVMANMHEFNDAVEKLVTRPFTTWIIPIMISIISFILGGLVDVAELAIRTGQN